MARAGGIAFVDVPIFGETALVPGAPRRRRQAEPDSFRPGRCPARRADGIVVAELTRTDAGTLAARGAMVPHHPFPPGIEGSGLPLFHDRARWAGRYRLHLPRRFQPPRRIVVTGPPAGIVSVGGYRFPLHDLQEVVSRIDSGATLAALPDPILGQRLIGNAADRDTMQAALNAVGVNPIVAAAFCDRREHSVSPIDVA